MAQIAGTLLALHALRLSDMDIIQTSIYTVGAIGLEARRQYNMSHG